MGAYLASQSSVLDNAQNGCVDRPTGLTNATDEALQALLDSLDRWSEALPEELVFKGVESNQHAGSSSSLSSRHFPSTVQSDPPPPSDRSPPSILHHNADDLLARLHAHLLSLSYTSQILPNRTTLDSYLARVKGLYRLGRQEREAIRLLAVGRIQLDQLCTCPGE